MGTLKNLQITFVKKKLSPIIRQHRFFWNYAEVNASGHISVKRKERNLPATGIFKI
jgi:hypothetical protein